MKEIFKDVKGYEGLYKISNTGKVIGTKELTPRKTRTGYLRVQLSRNNRVTDKYIHRLVAEHFLKNPNNKTEVNHKDFNKSNNEFTNLEWVTPQENKNHFLSFGKPAKRASFKGVDNGRAKLTERQIREIRLIKGKTIKALSEIYNVSHATIHRVIHKVSWRHI